jgi:hypothetical protein
VLPRPFAKAARRAIATSSPAPCSRPAATFSPPVFDPTRLAKPGGMSWGDVASGAIDNAPESAKNFALDVARPITHPIETVGARVTLVSMQAGIG